MDSRQFIAGSVAGCVGQCVGHPLDSIKVVMQTATFGAASSHKSSVVVSATTTATTNTKTHIPKALTAIQSALQMYHSPYGFRSFFRGLSLPLMTKSVEQCVAFGIKGAVGNFLSPPSFGNNEPPPRSFLENLRIEDDSYRAGISGSIAGACTALLLTPVYLVKVQLQATTTAQATHLGGPVEAVKATVARLGWRGLYTGALPTFLGSSIGYGFRFATYDKTVSWVRAEYLENDDDDETEQSKANNRNAKILSIVLGGGFAGMATWLSHFPLDLVANKMMAEVVLLSHHPEAKASSFAMHHKKGMMAQFRTIYNQQGWKGYFRGIGPCLLRAFPVNASIFLSYEVCMGGL